MWFCPHCLKFEWATEGSAKWGVGFQVGPPTRVFDAEVGQDRHGKPAEKQNRQQMQWLHWIIRPDGPRLNICDRSHFVPRLLVSKGNHLLRREKRCPKMLPRFLCPDPRLPRPRISACQSASFPDPNLFGQATIYAWNSTMRVVCQQHSIVPPTAIMELIAWLQNLVWDSTEAQGRGILRKKQNAKVVYSIMFWFYNMRNYVNHMNHAKHVNHVRLLS